MPCVDGPQASSEDKTLREFPGAYHELLMGPERPEALAALLAWIDGRLERRAKL